MALLLVVAMAIGFGACGTNGAREEQILPVAEPTAEEPAAVSAAEQKDPDAPLAREEKELVAEVVGGLDAKNLSDKELDTVIDRLVNEIGSTPNQPNGTTENTPNQPSGTTENTPSVDTSDKSGAYNDDGSMNQPFDEVYPELIEEEQVSFSGESILVKLADGTLTDGLKAAGIGALDEIVPMEDCAWYEAKLVEGAEPKTALAAVRALDEVLLAEYNYEIKVAAIDEAESFDEEQEQEYEQNGRFTDQWYFHHCGIVSGFKTLKHLGGDPSVVVAVIDTGVDYDHEDLKGNIWVNTGEIPDNGIDDDNNGYIDDYYGVDIVSGKGNADDTNGHGTHVAGIIAARHNFMGVLGIAYNVKIMPIKAAAHNGTLTQSDIAKAVLYAYANGAEVVNMSFGGSACSIAVQDALSAAYSRCVLVASAGNDGAKNEGFGALPNYPAALSYVLGVMSVDALGRESTFTNWDVTKYNGVEYELYAPGESIMSTLPNDKYGFLSGTSMAAPVVSAFAAILRSEYSDRDKYPTKFIYGQLAATSGYHAFCLDPDKHGTHNLPQIANLHDALTKLPKPELNVQDCAIFDDPKYSANNNGDGVIDAGETIALGLTLRNRWGMSENTMVTIDTLSQTGIADPYITIQNPTVDYGSVGTYSTKNCGEVYTDGELTGWENPFLITVSEDCPNNYRFTLNVTIQCGNALDEKDSKTYTFKGSVDAAVRSGFVLPSIIEEDMTLTGDRLYIIPRATVIQPGVTVTVEPGTHIQFWSNDPSDPYAEEGIAFLRVEGNFFVKGTKENPVYLYPSELKDNFILDFGEANNGLIRLEYADVTNYDKANAAAASRTGGISYAYGCTFRQNYPALYYRSLSNGVVSTYSRVLGYIGIDLAKNCVFYKLSGSISNKTAIAGLYDTCVFTDGAVLPGKNQNLMDADITLRNCVFLGNSFVDQTNPQYVNNSTLTIRTMSMNPDATVFYNSDTGTTYIDFRSDWDSGRALLHSLREQGGDYVVFETQEELEWLLERIQYNNRYDIGITYDYTKEKYVMADGSDLPEYLMQEGVTDGYHGNTVSLQKEGTLTVGNGYRAVFELPGKVLPEEITFRDYRLVLDTDTTLQLVPLSAPVQLGVEDFLYKSSDEQIVTVSKTGLVTPVGNGTADVWVYSLDRAVKNYVTVEVRDCVPLERIAFPAETAEVAVGEVLMSGCDFTPSNTTRRSLTYTSDHPEIAAVDAGGNVTGIASGTAVITAQSAETGADGQPLTASVTVTVYQKAKSLELASAAISASVADGATDLPAVIADEGAELSLTWRSTDEAVAVIENGKLQPKAAGTTTVIATDTRSGLSAAVAVIISENSTAAVKDVQANQTGNGEYYAVLLEDGRLYTWGGSYHKVPMLLAEDVKQISLDYSYCNVVRFDSSIASYVLSTNNFIAQEFSFDFDGRNIAKLCKERFSAYSYFAITTDGIAYAWGANEYGQLGIGTTGTADTPVMINLEGVVNIIACDNSTFFLTNAHKLYGAGKIQDQSYTSPILLDTDVTQIFPYPQYTYQTCSYLTEDGAWKSTGGYTYRTNVPSMEQIAISDTYAVGINAGRVYVFNRSQDSIPQQIGGISDAKFVYAFDGTYYVATENGLLLAVGKNPSTSNRIPGASGDVTTPTPILLEPVAEETVSVTGNNLENSFLRADSLTLSFNKALGSASPQLYADGSQTTFQSEIVDYNYLTVSRTSGFAVGVKYELVFPAGSLTAAGGVTNTEEIRIAFEALEKLPDDQKPEEIEEIHESQLDESVERILTPEKLEADFKAHLKQTQYNPHFTGNVILNPLTTDTDVSHWLRPTAATASSYTEIPFGGNWWGTTNESLIDRQIVDYADMPTYARLMYAPYLTEAPENTFPFVTDVTILNKDGEAITTVGNEKVTFRVRFNRDMDTSIPLTLTFGSAYPYADYEVSGSYVDARTWEGVYTVSTLIENGSEYLTISNGRSATDDLDLQTDRHRFSFVIDTTAAQALIMQGNATDTGIELKWTQDDFTTLMGYNVYRSTAEDGLYTKLNKTVIPVDTMTWFDDTVEPGVIYYYNFTVVQTDLSESIPSGKIVIMSKDTMAPNIYHSPVGNAFTGANLVLTATITDNLNIAYANLYYRVTGTAEWKTIRMNKLNDKYSAIIPASNVTLDGIEYYLEASDGVSSTFKGSAEEPFAVLVQEAIDENALGDVDGDGKITNLDALLVLYSINDKVNLTPEQFARADLNGDGELQAAEALRILQYVSGVVGSLKM